MRNLILFTATYPYGNGETFVADELEILSQWFSNIYIAPLQTKGSQRSIPSNCIVIKIDSERVSRMSAFLSVCKKSMSDKGYKHLTHLRHLISSEKMTLGLKAGLIKFLDSTGLNSENTVLYSYWMDRWANVICEDAFNEYNRVSRAHGFDLYDYRHPWGFIPYRKWQLQKLSKIFTISQDGQNYLTSLYPKYRDKINVSRLCTSLPKVRQEVSTGSRYMIVSCSSLVPLKRVDQIPLILNGIENISIEWLHFGDGPEKSAVEQAIKQLKPVHSARLMGHVNSHELYTFYSENFIDLFINVSMYDGVPVSIMEAISFGIPVVAPDVGGVSEIVTPQTGKLLDSDLNISEASKIICDQLETCSRIKEYRNTVYTFWLENYSISNHEKFATELVALLDE